MTFRSYVPVDGESHTFRVGIEYPSGSGSFLFSPGSFDAIDSPAVFNPALKEHYMGILEQYPALPQGPFGSAAPVAPPVVKPDVAISQDQDSEKSAAVPVVVTSAEPPPSPPLVGMDLYVEWLRNNVLLLAVGVAILLLLLGIIVVVKLSSRSNTAPYPTDSSRTTHKNTLETDTKTQPVNSVEFGGRK